MAIACNPLRCLAFVRLLGACLFAMLAVRPAHAATDEPRVAVPPLVVEGDVPDYLVQDLATRLQGGLGATAHAIDTPTSCADASCWIALAEQTSSTHVVRATLSVKDRDYDVRADLIDGRTGEVIATVERACDICGSAELATTVEDIADALRRKLASEQASPAVLVVTSTPDGASVSLDGAVVGTTPLTIEVPAGEHEIEVGKLEHLTQRRRIAFVDSVEQQWKVELVPAPTNRERSRRPMRIAGWTTIGVGLAGVGVGVGLALIDEDPLRSRCSGDNVDIEGNCKYRRDTLTGGIATAVVGAAVLGTGIALVLVDRKRHRDRRIAVMPTLRGIAVSGRF